MMCFLCGHTQVHAYLRPQESGNHVGVRWLSLRDEATAEGLLVSTPRTAAGPPSRRLSASAHHAVPDDLDVVSAEGGQTVSTHHLTKAREMQKHAAELVERDLTHLNLDYFQMGVGGVHSWGARPDEKFMLRPDVPYAYTFDLRPYAATDGTSLREMASRATGAAGAWLPVTGGASSAPEMGSRFLMSCSARRPCGSERRGPAHPNEELLQRRQR